MGILSKLRGLKSHDDFIPRDILLEDEFLPRTNYVYKNDTRHGLRSNVFMSPVMWVMRTSTEADARVQARRDGMWQFVEDHPVELLLANPNPFYGGDSLFKAIALSYQMDGNAYLHKIRNGFDSVLQLDYIPHWLIKPITQEGSTDLITAYEYTPAGERFLLDPRDVVHIRFGLDPRDIRIGYSPLKALLREIFIDDEAANFSASILRNMGVPGLLVSPKEGGRVPSADEVQQTKDFFREEFVKDRRGEPLVMGAPTDVKQFGFDPNQLTLSALRDITEERVCAALGIPAAVIGFGAGLQQTKVGATMRELRKLAWVQSINPMQKTIGKELGRQLLPEFVRQTRRFRIRFDRSEVSAFVEEETEKAKRIGAMVERGFLRVDRAQEMMGLEVDETQDVYLRPNTIQAGAANEDPIESDRQTFTLIEPPPESEDGAESIVQAANRVIGRMKAAVNGRGD